MALAIVAVLWKSSRLVTIGMALLTVATALIPPFQACVGREIIDSALAAHSMPAGAARQVPSRRALAFVGLEFLLILGLTSAERMIELLKKMMGARLAMDINLLIMAKALKVSLGTFDSPSFCNRLVAARRESSVRPISFVQGQAKIVRNILILSGYVYLLVHFSTVAVGLLVLAGLPAFFAEMRFSAKAYRLRNAASPEFRRIRDFENLAANSECAKEIRILGLEEFILERYRLLAERIHGEDGQLTKVRTFWSTGLSSLSVAASYSCYGLIVWYAASGRMSIGEMALYLTSFRQALHGFQAILVGLGQIYEDSLGMANVFQYLHLTEQPRRRGGGQRSGERGIRLEGVSFRHDESSRWILRDLDLFIPPGQTVAILGRNGTGKTTLIKVITGLYQPTCGRVLLDGCDLRDWLLPELRRRFAVAFQDVGRYQFDLRDNVAIGDVEHVDDDSRVIRAVRSAGLGMLVGALPKGLRTPLGAGFEGGVELSGGQWQAVALSRTFMREGADILVLDEPTSALDAVAEDAWVKRFQRLSQDRTTLVISHRPKTIRMADRILLLSGGRLIGDGTHGDLARGNRLYARFVESWEQEGARDCSETSD